MTASLALPMAPRRLDDQVDILQDHVAFIKIENRVARFTNAGCQTPVR